MDCYHTVSPMAVRMWERQNLSKSFFGEGLLFCFVLFLIHFKLRSSPDKGQTTVKLSADKVYIKFGLKICLVSIKDMSSSIFFAPRTSA